MPDWGAAVVIVVDGRILLTKREDFEVWCLPGGAVEPGEFVADAAVREAREETGFQAAVPEGCGKSGLPARCSP